MWYRGTAEVFAHVFATRVKPRVKKQVSASFIVVALILMIFLRTLALNLGEEVLESLRYLSLLMLSPRVGCER